MINNDKKEEIFISNHGSVRLVDRLKCNKSKIKKIVSKAYYSKCDKISHCYEPLLTSKGSDNSIYRYYLGYVFIFAMVAEGILFVTLYNPKVPNDRGETTYVRRKNK